MNVVLQRSFPRELPLQSFVQVHRCYRGVVVRVERWELVVTRR